MDFISNLHEHREKIGTIPGAVFGTYTRTKKPFGLDAWTDSMFYVTRGMRLALSRTGYGANWGDDTIRGYNATASSMTANTIDAKLRDTLAQASLSLGIKDKDWDQGQIADVVDKAIIDTLILYKLRKQKQHFDVLLNPEEDSAYTTGDEYCWDFDDLNAMISSLSARQYPIMNISVELAKLFTPLFKVAPGYPEKAFPIQYFTPFDDRLSDDAPAKFTVSAFETLRNIGFASAEGLIHAKKISLLWKPFSSEMLNYDIYDMQSREAMLYREGMHFSYYDGASIQYARPTGSFHDSAHSSKVLPISTNGHLDDIFAWLWLIDSDYNAVGDGLAVSDVAINQAVEDKGNFGKSAITATVMTEPISWTETLELFPILTQSMVPLVVLTGAGDATQAMIPRSVGNLLYPGQLSITGISSTVFESAFEAMLIRLWAGGRWNENKGGSRGEAFKGGKKVRKGASAMKGKVDRETREGKDRRYR